MNNFEKPYIDFNNVFKESCQVNINNSNLEITVGDTIGVVSPIGVTTNNCVVFTITENLIPKVYDKFLLSLTESYIVIGLGNYYSTKALPMIFKNKTIYLDYSVLMHFSTKHLISGLMEFKTIEYR